MLKIAKNKVTGILTIFMMVLTIILTMTPGEAQAASKKTKAMRAYKTYLTKVRKNKAYKDSKFAIAYINNDKIPELYVNYDEPELYRDEEGSRYLKNYQLKLYTYSKGKLKLVDTFDWEYDSFENPRNKYKYYKETGIFSVKYHSPDSCSDGISYHSMTKKPFKFSNDYKHKPVNRTIAYRDLRDNYSIIYSGTNRYKYKTVARKAFNKYVKKVTKGKKATTVKFVKNTAKNAKKKLK